MKKVYDVLNARIERWLCLMNETKIYMDLSKYKTKAMEDLDLLLELGGIDFISWSVIEDRIFNAMDENIGRICKLKDETES